MTDASVRAQHSVVCPLAVNGGAFVFNAAAAITDFAIGRPLGSLNAFFAGISLTVCCALIWRVAIIRFLSQFK